MQTEPSLINQSKNPKIALVRDTKLFKKFIEKEKDRRLRENYKKYTEVLNPPKTARPMQDDNFVPAKIEPKKFIKNARMRQISPIPKTDNSFLNITSPNFQISPTNFNMQYATNHISPSKNLEKEYKEKLSELQKEIFVLQQVFYHIHDCKFY